MSAKLIELLYPATCQLCGAPGRRGRDLCQGCAADLPWNRPACGLCGLPLTHGLANGALCGRCQKTPPPFDRCVAALRYERVVPSLVTGAKFRGRLNAARLLGQCLVDVVQAEVSERPDVLMPVPLHPGRLRQRGYNQSLEIARSVARSLGLAIETRSCRRTASTPPQAGLDERARRRNVRGAFEVRGDLDGLKIAVLDDVVTTGSTVSELSRVLRRAGAVSIQVWAVARTP